MLYAKIELTRQERFTLNVEIVAHPGEVVALFGPSGAGKSTILRTIAGFEKQATAQITVNQQRYQNSSFFLPINKRHIGYISQYDDLFPNMTLKENIQFALQLMKSHNRETAHKTEELIPLLQLENRLSHYPHQLSKGEIQRGKLARALAQNPNILLLDEPFSNIDNKSKFLILNHLKSINQSKEIYTLFVSHSLNEILAFSDQLYILEEGKIAASGSTITTLSNLQNPIAKSNAACSLLELNHHSYDQCYQIVTAAHAEQHFHFHAKPEHLQNRYRIAIYAKDVSLFLSKPEQSSVLNILVVTIFEIESIGLDCILKLRLGNQFILAKITTKSLNALNLHIGQTAFALIKCIAIISADFSD